MKRLPVWHLTLFLAFSICCIWVIIADSEPFANAKLSDDPNTVSSQVYFESAFKIDRDIKTFILDPLSFPRAAQIPSVPPQYIQYQNKVVVLMYHHIALSEANENITITPERFQSHLQALKDNHYQVISMENYIHFLMDDKPVPPNAVVITFDDGYESFYKFAYPILKQMHFTATNFIVVSYIDSYNPKLPFLTWDEIQEMHKDGFSFYSHTYNLHRTGLNGKKEQVPALTNRLYLDKKERLETEEEYEQRVKDDLFKAKTIIHDKLHTNFPLLSFPFGDYNQTVIDIARSMGIQYFFTTREGINGETTKQIQRINAGTRFVSADRLIEKLNNFKAKRPSPAPSQ